jgi:hypothetical protein
MSASAARDEVAAWRRHVFRHLRANGTSRAARDAFEAFLRAPGTLSRSSLVVRCRFHDGGFDCRVVIDRPVSRRRLTGQLIPFLRRVRPRLRARADVFVLVSDNVYVADGSRARFADFLKRVPFLRCDWRDDDDLSAHAVPIPDFSLQDDAYAAELAAIEGAVSRTPFAERREVVMWRGRLSGPGYPDLENREDFPRYRLVMLSLRHPEIVDARLTNYTNFTDGESAAALRRRLEALLGSPAPELPAESFVSYKYLVSVDGAVAAWKRVPTILASGSVLLLQHRWKQFFSPALKPWEHYVPLADDVSDLVARYEWLQAHPERAAAIAENGRRFAREVLRPGFVEDYFVDVIGECAGVERA